MKVNLGSTFITFSSLTKSSLSLSHHFTTPHHLLNHRSFYMFIGAATNLNKIIQYATRFTDEIFALLIAAIFIIDAIGSPFAPVGLYYYFNKDHESHEAGEDDPDYQYLSTAFLSLILGLGTTMMVFFLKSIKFSPFCFTQGIRSSITDFSVPASIMFFTILDKVIFTQVETEQLNTPDTFAPSFNCCTKSCESFFPDDCLDQEEAYGRRPWIVDLSDLNGKSWVPFVAAFPALLAFVLVFLDDGITWHLSKLLVDLTFYLYMYYEYVSFFLIHMYSTSTFHSQSPKSQAKAWNLLQLRYYCYWLHDWGEFYPRTSLARSCHCPFSQPPPRTWK